MVAAGRAAALVVTSALEAVVVDDALTKLITFYFDVDAESI